LRPFEARERLLRVELGLESLVGFLSAHAKAPAAAKALLQYLSSPDAAVVYRAAGMQPGS
jgi:hypothetical protein